MKNKRLNFLKEYIIPYVNSTICWLELNIQEIVITLPLHKKKNGFLKKTVEFSVLKSTMSWFILADGVSVVFGLDHFSHCSVLSFLVLFPKEILGSYADPLFKVTLIILM